MKPAKTVLLVVLLFLPVVTVFVFDVQYSQLQKSVCASTISIETSYACKYPERNERERLVTTAFYRHIADYFGREAGTSPSWLDEAATKDYALKHTIGDFNRSFAISMLVSVIGASVAGTLLAQDSLSAYRRQKRRPVSESSTHEARPLKGKHRDD